jgi:phospholipid-binding lipoprotein MlaA
MRHVQSLVWIGVLLAVAGCSTTPVQQEPIIPAQRPVGEWVTPDVVYTIDAFDPWEPMNRRIYNFNAVFDEYVFLPVVRAYEFVLPDVAQTGVTNFFRNLTEITNLTNSLLQFKIVKALNTTARIIINSTVGIGGLIDVAAMKDGIERENEDFGQTLGFYGLGPGPYLVLPVLGPSSVRDTGGLVVDTVVYNVAMNQLFDQFSIYNTERDVLNWGLTALYAIDKRHTESFRYFMTGSPFEYELIRRLYLLKREFLIDN